MRLGEKLVQEGAITDAQLDTALRAQVVYGGRIGTNLIELEYLTLDRLTRALAEQKGVPAALESNFEAVDAATLELLPARLAEKHQAIPIGLARLAGRRLVVAFADPGQIRAHEEIGLATGARIIPCVAPELRILHYLEKFYGVARKNRYLRVDQKTAASTPPASTPPAPAAAGPAPAQPERRRHVDTPPPAPVIVPAATPPPVVVAPRPAITLQQAVERMAAAATREEIGDAIVDHLRSIFSCALLFITKGPVALGWKGFAPGVSPEIVESLTIPLNTPSMLRLAYDGRAVYRGAPPADGAAIQQRMWKVLHLRPPGEVIVAPVLVAGRVVNLIYAHGTEWTQDPAPLYTAASAAFLRLLQQLKHH